jgi:hypothetical protein
MRCSSPTKDIIRVTVDEEGGAEPRRLIGSVSEAQVIVLHDGTLLSRTLKGIGDWKR